MNLTATSATAPIRDDVGDGAADVLVASKALAETKQEGAETVALVQAAIPAEPEPPPPNGARGGNVNVMA